MLNFANDLEALFKVLPPQFKETLDQINDHPKLIEIIMDLGRLPEARFTDREVLLSDKEVTAAEIEYVTHQLSGFMSDNRAGIERTLHRISAIRNRLGKIVGLTCRVGRAVFGTVEIVRDILESGESLLLLGRPGVGKTTLLREAARILSSKKRVVIVDTSNEIAGDGDIPHPAIGRARRMQVADPSLQHEVMIEAVENHMPEVIIIDEIGRALEAEAARTIAERGVQLVGTAHGISLENLLSNPTLSDLVGGIDSVTLSDEEARRRGTQKSVLERRSPPTFDVLVEIQDRQTFMVHRNVAQSVDMFLRQRPIKPELRHRDESGEIKIEPAVISELPQPTERRQSGNSRQFSRGGRNGMSYEPAPNQPPPPPPLQLIGIETTDSPPPPPPRSLRPVKVFPYGIGQNRLLQAAKNLQLPVILVEDLRQADVLMTMKNFYRKHPQPIAEAEHMGKPVYVLRSNTAIQMESCLADIFSLGPNDMDHSSSALRETQDAIRKVLTGVRSVELTPQASDIRREQHQLVRQANLLSHSLGREPRRRVRIYQNNGPLGEVA